MIARLRQALDVMRTSPLRSAPVLGLLAALVLCHLSTVIAAVAGQPWWFLASVLACTALDLLAEATPTLRYLLDRSNLGLIIRCVIRDFTLMVLVARLSFPDWDVLLVASMSFVLIVARAALLAADRNVTQFQAPRILTRNLHIDAVQQAVPVPAVSPSWICLIAAAPLVVGAAAIPLGQVWPYSLGVAAFAVFTFGWTIWRMGSLVAHRRRSSPSATLALASDEVAGLRPQAVLYFSGEADAIYQVNMWLSTMERLGVPVIILLREKANLPLVGQTTLPIICIPSASDLMDFRLPTVRVGFFVAHVGKNIHLMREPRIKTVFIGHGESDKVASVNPVTKGFDEVWVAGRVSRERWAAAKVGVRDEAIVEVGRPQLAGILEASPMPTDRRISVLYAPTWEGWTSDPYSCSLITMGPSLVRWLLQQPGLRVIYKPHPFTGKVSAAARRANAQVISLINGNADGAVLAGSSAEDWAAVTDKHLVVAGPTPTLYDCFNHSDLLIGDISSVVPDFMSSGKPYVIPNPAGRDHEELRAASASARGGYLLDPRSEGWQAVLDDAIGADSMQATRAELRLALLGPHYDDPIEPWRFATHDLIRRANEEWPDAEREASRRIDD